MSGTIKVGDLVIRGDCDAPCEQTVSLVLSIEDDRAKIIYVARRLRKNTSKELRKSSQWDISMLTKVEEFGVDWFIDTNNDLEYFIRFDRVGESRARYPDGTPRRWQPCGYACVITTGIRQLILRYAGREKLDYKTFAGMVKK